MQPSNTQEHLDRIEARLRLVPGDELNSVSALREQIASLEKQVNAHQEWLKRDSQHAENLRLREQLAEMERSRETERARADFEESRIVALCEQIGAEDLELAADKLARMRQQIAEMEQQIESACGDAEAVGYYGGVLDSAMTCFRVAYQDRVREISALTAERDQARERIATLEAALREIIAKFRGAQCEEPICDGFIGATLETARAALSEAAPPASGPTGMEALIHRLEVLARTSLHATVEGSSRSKERDDVMTAVVLLRAAMGSTAAPATQSVKELPSTASRNSANLRPRCQYCVDGTIGETDWTGSIHDIPCSECGGTSLEPEASSTAAPPQEPPRSMLRPVNEPLPDGCHCQPGRCAAPVIMGRQMPCRDPQKATASPSDVRGEEQR